MDEAGWQNVVVRVPLMPDYEAGVRKLRALERWLADNHRPVALFRADGRPRGEVVCLAVPAERPERVLAWRSFCGDLGVSAGMVQWRTAPYRTLPPEPPFSMGLD
ncbi:MAG: hypothetical protein AB7I79_21935 [Rhizobiaceae bacterium]